MILLGWKRYGGEIGEQPFYFFETAEDILYIHEKIRQDYQTHRRTKVTNPKPSPIGSLLQSRKFNILLLDTVVALILYFSAKYLLPTVNDDILFVIGLLQIPVAVIINAISKEDAANAAADATIIASGNAPPGNLASKF